MLGENDGRTTAFRGGSTAGPARAKTAAGSRTDPQRRMAKEKLTAGPRAFVGGTKAGPAVGRMACILKVERRTDTSRH